MSEQPAASLVVNTLLEQPVAVDVVVSKELLKPAAVVDNKLSEKPAAILLSILYWSNLLLLMLLSVESYVIGTCYCCWQ